MPSRAEETAFLAPVLARYGDDGPRLIYADFLDESDDPADRARAELIRVQCALARLAPDHSRRSALLSRETELLQANLDRWTEPLRGLVHGVEFRRGLPDSVSVDLGTFLARGNDLFRAAPVRRVRILDANPDAGALADCPHLGRVRELVLVNCRLGNGGLNALLHSEHLGAVEMIDLSFNGLDDDGVRRLAGSTALPRLRSLLLTDNERIGAGGLHALAESPHFAGLTALDVSGNDVADAGVRAVAESRFLTKLNDFKLYANRIGDAGAEVLARSELLGRMLARDPRLDLRQNGIGPPGARALARSPQMAKAVGLDLSANYLQDEGLTALADSPHLTRLRRLAVRQNQVGDAGAAALALAPLMDHLTRLDVSSNRLTRIGVDALWRSRKDWRTEIEIAGNYLWSDGTDACPADGPRAPVAVEEALLRRASPDRA